jgi:hypothetical protein
MSCLRQFRFDLPESAGKRRAGSLRQCNQLQIAPADFGGYLPAFKVEKARNLPGNESAVGCRICNSLGPYIRSTILLTVVSFSWRRDAHGRHGGTRWQRALF